MKPIEISIEDKIKQLEKSIEKLSLDEYNNSKEILSIENLILCYYQLLMK